MTSLDFWIDFKLFTQNKNDKGVLYRLFGNFSKQPDTTELYNRALFSTRAGIPWNVRIAILPGTYKQKEIVYIKLTSTPTAYYQNYKRNYIDEIICSKTIKEQNEFVEGYAHSLMLHTIKEPEQLHVKKYTLPFNELHPLIIEKCNELLLNEQYIEEVRDVDIFIESTIRNLISDNKSAYRQILTNLFTWNCNKSPGIYLADINDPHFVDIHNGTVHLISAMSILSRNTHMHTDDKISANECFSILWNYTIILNAIDTGKKQVVI
jgi:hypothetical protein